MPAERVKLEEAELASNREKLHKNHQDIGATMGKLAATYSKLKRYNDALRLNKEMLVFYKRVLPKGR